MDELIKKLLYDANLIIQSHHDGCGASVTQGIYDLRQTAMWLSGWNGYKHDVDLWEEWIPKLPESIRKTMIELSDCMDCHDGGLTTQF